MPVLNGERLQYGLDEAVPTNAQAAWGARLIVTQAGHVDLVPDRQSLVGTEVDALVAHLDTHMPVGRLAEKLGQLLRHGTILTRLAVQHVIYQDDLVTIVADTKASAGYCYVAAWLRPGD